MSLTIRRLSDSWGWEGKNGSRGKKKQGKLYLLKKYRKDMQQEI